MKVALLTDAPYCRDVRAQRTVKALQRIGADIMVFDQGFYVDESHALLKGKTAHFSSLVPSGKLGRLVWHTKNRLLPRINSRALNDDAYNALVQYEPDMVHLVNPFLGDAALKYIAKQRLCKLVYEAYEYWPEYLFNREFGVHKSLRDHLKNCEVQLLKKSSLFVTVSEPIVDFYREHADIRKSAVIYNSNVPDENKRAAETEKGASISHPLKLIFSGQFVRDRHVDKLLEALSLVDKPYSLLLLGSGSQENLYRAIISRNHLEDKVMFAKPVPHSELIGTLKEFDIGFNFGSASTRQENGAAPNKIFDYLRAGLAIVSNETDGVKSLGLDEIIEYVPCDDENALVSTLNDLLNDEERILNMKKNSQNRAREFSPEVEIEKLAELYVGLES